jgi:hypothetical protein
MPILADFLLHIGMMMASELGRVRFEMVRVDDERNGAIRAVFLTKKHARLTLRSLRRINSN